MLALVGLVALVAAAQEDSIIPVTHRRKQEEQVLPVKVTQVPLVELVIRTQVEGAVVQVPQQRAHLVGLGQPHQLQALL